VRRRVHWVRDANGRFAISREQPVEQPAGQSDQSPPNADAGAGRGDAPPQSPNMNDLIRSRLRGGSPFDWQREREGYE
jgi:hypothetical protein